MKVSNQKIEVGTYSDGSGPMVKVWFDGEAHNCTDQVWMETGGSNWLAFDYTIAEQVCEAIMKVAATAREYQERAQS